MADAREMENELNETGAGATLGHDDDERSCLRVLSVLHYADFGGPHNRNMRLHPYLAQSDVELTVLLPEESGSAAARLDAAGVPVITQGLGRMRATLNPWTQFSFVSSFWRDVLRLKRLIRQRGFDVIQINGLENPHAAIAGRLAGAAVVWQLLATRLPSPLTIPLMLLARLSADALMSTGMRVAQMHPWAASFGPRLIPFYPPVDCGQFDPGRVSGEQTRAMLLVGPDEPLIGTLGNLNPQKGHEVFIRAAAKVRRQRPDARFVIFGHPVPTHRRYREGLHRLAASLGFTLNKDLLFHAPENGNVAGALASLDFFAMTSVRRSEGVPTAALEAMAMGKMVISTDVGSLREIIEDGVHGFLVPANRPDAVADRMLWALSHTAEVRAIGADNRAVALNRFAVKHCANRHLKAYAAAIRHARERRIYGFSNPIQWHHDPLANAAAIRRDDFGGQH